MYKSQTTWWVGNGKSEHHRGWRYGDIVNIWAQGLGDSDEGQDISTV